MKVESFKVEGGAVTYPFVRIELNGRGCGAEACTCSPDNFISISDGKVGLSVELTFQEVALILSGTGEIR